VMMASQHVPDRVIRQQLASAIHLVCHVSRMSDGSRKVTGISEVVGVKDDQIEMQDIFFFDRTGVTERGKVIGSFRATGAMPLCMDRLRGFGIRLSKAIFSEVVEVKEK